MLVIFLKQCRRNPDGCLLLQFKSKLYSKGLPENGRLFLLIHNTMKNSKNQQMNLCNVKSMICIMIMTFVYVC
jgi:hypothetical protein